MKSDDEHPIFKTEGESLDAEGYLFTYDEENEDESGCTIGLENKSSKSFQLKLQLEGLYCIDPQYKGKENFKLAIDAKSKKVFNAKYKDGDEDPSFNFDIL